MKIFSIKSVASRGWMTIFISSIGMITSVVLMANGMAFGRDLLNAMCTIFPIGAYEIYRGRTKYKGVNLAEYTKKYQHHKKGIVYALRVPPEIDLK